MRRGNTSNMDGTDDDEADIGKTRYRSATKRPSILSNMSGASDGNTANSGHIDINRINSLKASVNRHTEIISKFLLTSKETAEKRSQIETAFRFCKDAFLEMATSLACLLEAQPKTGMIEEVKQVIREAMEDIKEDIGHKVANMERESRETREKTATYASVAATGASEVRVSRGPTFKVPASMSFMIMPDESHVGKYASSNATREACINH